MVKIKGRRCTDVPFLLLLLLCWAGMSAVSYYAVGFGNLNRLKYGTDSEGNLCGAPVGVDSARNLTGMENVYYFNLSVSTSYKMCVSACPNETDFSSVLCKYGVTASNDSANLISQILASDCIYALKSTAVLNRCIPNVLINAINSTSSAINRTTSTWASALSSEFNGRSVASKIYQDVVRFWKIILGCAGIAFGFSLFWLVVIQFLGGVFVWLSLIIGIACTSGAASYLLYNYYTVYVQNGQLVTTGFSSVDTLIYHEKILLALGIISAVIALGLLLMVCCLIGRIRLAVVIIQEASKAMRTMPGIPLFSIFKYIGLLGLMAWFTFNMVLLATSGASIGNSINASLNSTLGSQYASNNAITYAQIYYVFGFLWSYNWVVAIGQTTVAGAVASWYWSEEKRSFRPLAVTKSFFRAVTYHLGSLAFGSLILTLVQFLQYLLVQAQKKTQNSPANNNLTKTVFCCLQCCLKCVEGVIMLINRNAFIMISISGKSYCTSAKRAFKLVTSNGIRIFVLHRAASFLVFLGKISVLFLTTLCGIALLNNAEGSFNKTTESIVSNWAVPLVFIIIFAWVIANSTLSIFEMAIDTVFLCFCEDCELNDGSSSKPYFMNDSLRKFVDHKTEMEIIRK